MDTDSDQLANLLISTNSKCDFNSDLDGENCALFTISWLFRVCVS